MYAIAQTGDGHLWLGTQAGLARFDGVEFQVFDRSNTPALRNAFVRALVEDRSGSLWIGTNGAGLVRYRDGRVESVTIPGLPPEVRVLDLEETSGGLTWVATDGGLARYDGQAWTVLGDGAGLPSGAPRCLLATPVRGLLVGTDDGLARWDGKSLAPLPDAVRLRGRRVMALLEDRRGTLWVGTDRGLYLFGPDSQPRSMHADGLAGGRILALHEDRDGAVWVGTDRGLARWYQGELVTMPQASALGNDQVLALESDREGNLWVGTGVNGLHELVDGKLSTFGRDEGLRDPRVRCVYQDPQGTVWLGTDSGLARLAGGKLTLVTTRDGLSDDRVTTVLRERDGRLWVGTYGGGLNVLEGARWRAFKLRGGLAGDVVTSLLEDSQGSIWVGTDRGLSVIRGGVADPRRSGEGLPRGPVMFVHESRDGRLWVGSYGGGVAVGDARSWRLFTSRDGLADDKVISIHEAEDGEIWLGTLGGGLSWFADDRFYSVDSRDGLPDDNVFAILEDAAGDLWMSSLKGIFRASKDELRVAARYHRTRVPCVLYAEADGMRSRECSGGSQPAGWKARDGRLWFATVGGAVVIDPARAGTPLRAPLVTVEGVVADGEAYSSRTGITLPPGTRSLEVHFAGLSFYDPSRVIFRYRLDGFDREWVDCGARRAAFFTALSPGSYQFRVVAVNQDGVASAEARVGLTLLPRFSQTRTFVWAVALAVAATLLAAYRWRLRRLRAKMERLSQLAEERRRTAERLDYLAHHDLLTGLPNRLWFSAHLGEVIEGAIAEGSGFVIQLLDLDAFKEINSAFGHEVGDRILRRVARRLEVFFGPEAAVARTGGDEFATLVPRSLLGQDLGGDVRAVLELVARPFHVAGRVLRLTGTVGVACYPDDGDDAEMLLKSAEVALMEGKRQGGNTFATSTEQMRESAGRRAVLKNELREAIRGGELELRFQPQVAPNTGEIAAAEALIRWRHPRLGVVLPEAFVDLAEQTGLIYPIGRWVLREACLACVQWRAQNGGRAAVGVNLSAREFRGGDLVQVVAATLSEVGLEPAGVVLEITETTAMWDIDETVEILRKLRGLGLRIALDDFGKGYSSLTYLKRFPVQIIKIDQSFVRELLVDASALGIVRGVISIAHALGLEVVAEGVETGEQLEELRASGCDLVQGFWYAAPMTLAELTTMMRREPARLE